MVGHGVSPHDGLVIDHFEVPKPKLVPLTLEGVRVLVVIRVGRHVHVLVLHSRRRHVDLDVSARFEIKAFSFRKANDELLNEGGHIVIGHHFALPLLDAEHLLGDLDFHVLLDLDLTSKTPVIGNLLAREMGLFGGED